MFIRKPYDVVANRRASADANVQFEKPSRVKREFREDADINTIVRRFGLTGSLPPARAVPQYGDFSEVMDFHSAMNAIRSSQEAFDSLPAQVRDRFANDPGRLLEFLQDDENRAEAVKLGLIPAPPVVAAAPVEVSPGASSEAEPVGS